MSFTIIKKLDKSHKMSDLQMRAIILGTFIMEASGFILFVIHFHAYYSVNLIISSGKCFIMREKISKSSLKNLATFAYGVMVWT